MNKITKKQKYKRTNRQPEKNPKRMKGENRKQRTKDRRTNNENQTNKPTNKRRKWTEQRTHRNRRTNKSTVTKPATNMERDNRVGSSPVRVALPPSLGGNLSRCSVCRRRFLRAISLAWIKLSTGVWHGRVGDWLNASPTWRITAVMHTRGRNGPDAQGGRLLEAGVGSARAFGGLGGVRRAWADVFLVRGFEVVRVTLASVVEWHEVIPATFLRQWNKHLCSEERRRQHLSLCYTMKLFRETCSRKLHDDLHRVTRQLKHLAPLHGTLSAVVSWKSFTKPTVLHDPILGETCIALQFHEKSFTVEHRLATTTFTASAKYSSKTLVSSQRMTKS